MTSITSILLWRARVVAETPGGGCHVRPRPASLVVEGRIGYSSRMGLEARGRIHKINDAQQVTERFRKREFVVELTDNPRYPQYVQFQLTGDRCEMLDDYREGDEVQLEFSLRGREWTSPRGEIRYFNSLDVWTIERAGDADQPPPPDDPGGPTPDDDIPF